MDKRDRAGMIRGSDQVKKAGSRSARLGQAFRCRVRGGDHHLRGTLIFVVPPGVWSGMI